MDAVSMFQNKFRWNKASPSPAFSSAYNCIESKFRNVAFNHFRLLQIYSNLQEHLLQRIYEENLYDFSIYLEYLKNRNLVIVNNGGRDLLMSYFLYNERMLNRFFLSDSQW